MGRASGALPLASFFLLALAAPAAMAKGQLQVGTTLIELPAGAKATHFSLLNTGDEPLSAQVRVYAWVQADGDDRLAPTRALVLSPPISTIAAHGEQVIRVIASALPGGQRDATYRVVVDELPGKEAAPGRIEFRMRYVVPLYARASTATAPALDCRLEATALTCVNTGGQAAQFGATRLTGSGSAYSMGSGLFGYVLPGATRRWVLDAARIAALGQPRTLETRLNGQPATLPLAPSR